jgi:LmbE family N-acetylglucosaminyl deacetylase
VSDPPTLDELRQWIRVRERECQRFMEGMGVSQKPEELDARNKELLGDLARLKIELRALDRALRRTPPKEAEALRAVLAGL